MTDVLKQVKICNKKGLHARAAACFVKQAEKYDAEIWVEKDTQRVGADSIMGLMMLAASCGNEIKIMARGADAKQAVDALVSLVQNRFGEAE